MKKIIIAFISLSYCLAHAGSNGALDTTFNPTPSALPGQPGGEGIPLADFQGSATFSIALAVVIDGNGKIVAAGESDADGGHNCFCIVRLNDNGSLDNTLNNAGAFLGVPGIETIWTASFGAGTNSAEASGIALLSDGRIALGGLSQNSGVVTMAAALLTPLHGALDTTFNPNPPNQYPGVPGIESIPTASFGSGTTGASCNGVAVQANNMIVLAGQADPTGAGTGSMSVVRLTTTGGLDPNFNASHALIGNPGAATIPIADFPAGATLARAGAVVIQPDQKIVIAGIVTVAGIDSMAVARLTTAGALDGTFGGVGGAAAGITVIPNSTFGATNSTADAVAVQTIAGVTKIIVAGTATVSGVLSMAIARLNTDGTVDMTFNAGGATPGAVVVPLSAFGSAGATSSSVLGIQVQSDGKIVAGGVANTNTVSFMAAVRLTTTGGFDPTFNPTIALPGTQGVESIPLAVTAASTFSQANAIVLDSQSRIVLAGDGDTNGIDVFNFVRLSNTSAPPTPSGPISPIAAAIIAKYC